MHSLSPLHMVHQALAQKAGVSAEVLPSGETQFGYTVTFPDMESGCKVQPPLEYDVIVDWADDTRKLILRILVARNLIFKPWQGMADFFTEISDNVQPFLPIWEGGLLTPGYPYGEKKKVLSPGFQAVLTCPKHVDEDILKDMYNAIAVCAFKALLLTRPIFKRIARTGKPPPLVERMHLLEREFGLFELYYVPSESRKINLPRGWYESLCADPAKWIN